MSRYKFKGYTITNCGYHQPDHCVWWEAVDENGEACFHGHSLREVEFQILDYEWEQKMKKKDEEIEKLKREKIEVEADALTVGGIVEAARTAEKSSAVGNAAAMREALDDVLDKIDRWRTDGVMEHWQYSQLFDIADSALSAPAMDQEFLKSPMDLNERPIHIGDTVHMLNTGHDGDHEWDDVVLSLEYIGKSGGDDWLVHGEDGAAWACECEVLKRKGEGDGSK